MRITSWTEYYPVAYLLIRKNHTYNKDCLRKEFSRLHLLAHKNESSISVEVRTRNDGSEHCFRFVWYHHSLSAEPTIGRGRRWNNDVEKESSARGDGKLSIPPTPALELVRRWRLKSNLVMDSRWLHVRDSWQEAIYWEHSSSVSRSFIGSWVSRVNI